MVGGLLVQARSSGITPGQVERPVYPASQRSLDAGISAAASRSGASTMGKDPTVERSLQLHVKLIVGAGRKVSIAAF